MAMSSDMSGPVQVLTPVSLSHGQPRDVYSNRGSTVSAVTQQLKGFRFRAGEEGETEKDAVGGSSAVGVPGEDSVRLVEGTKVVAVKDEGGRELDASNASAKWQHPRSHSGRQRRLFVQTESGAVVVVEVERGAGGGGRGASVVGQVKRSVQAALNVPTEQADLVFGGHVLEGDDLAELQSDVPVLLRREITRSASSPCLTSLAAASGLCCASCDSAGLCPPPGVGSGHAGGGAVGGSVGGGVSGGGGGGGSALFEVVGGVQPHPMLRMLIQEAMNGVASGVEPVGATGGLGGAYYFRNAARANVVIVKPTDEEPFAPNNPNGYVGRSLGQPGLKKAIRVGEAGLREVAAYLLDHDHFAGVPYTALVRAAHPIFNVNPSSSAMPASHSSSAGPSFGCASSSLGLGVRAQSLRGLSRQPSCPSKLCSMQQFVQHDYDASEHGTSRFPVSAVHRIGILDVRIFNTDRHSGNILVRRVGEGKYERRHSNPAFRVDEAVLLTPIDHGFCLPETLEGAYFEWLHWPQASLPFSAEELEYISGLNVDAEVAMLRERVPMLREGCLRVLVLSTTLLQRGAAAGLTLADIGAVMSRELRRMEEVASELELLCLEAMRIVTSSGGSALSPTAGASIGNTRLMSPGMAVGVAVGTGGGGEFVQGSPRAGGGGSVSGESSHGGLFEFDDDTFGVEEAEEEEEEEGGGACEGVVRGAGFWGAQAAEASRVAGFMPSLSASLAAESRMVDCTLLPRWPVLPMHLSRGVTKPTSAWASLPGAAPGVPRCSDCSRLAPSHLSVRLSKAHALPPRATADSVPGTMELVTETAQRSSANRKEKQATSAAATTATAAAAARVTPRTKRPARHASLSMRRFNRSAPLAGAGPGSPCLKLGSAGALGSRLRAAGPTCTEKDLEGHLPGGASFLLSDMDEATWEAFYEVYLDLLDVLLSQKAAEHARQADRFGTSCQF